MAWGTLLSGVGLTLLLALAAEACDVTYFGDGIGNFDVVDFTSIDTTSCSLGQRIEYITVHHGHWVDGINMKCSGTDEIEPVIGQDNDGQTEGICAGDFRGIANMTAILRADQYPAGMNVTCVDDSSGESSEVGPFGIQDSDQDRLWTACEDGYYASGFAYQFPADDSECGDVASYCTDFLSFLRLMCLPIECLAVEETPAPADALTIGEADTSSDSSSALSDFWVAVISGVVLIVVGGVMTCFWKGIVHFFRSRCTSQAPEVS